MLKVYIGENVFTEPRLMEVSSDTLVSALIPPLVEELHLSQTDPLGNRLIYILRRAADGWVVPANVTLRVANIQPGTHLALDSYVAAELPVLAGQAGPSTSQNQSFYHEQTIADHGAFPVFANSSPPPPSQSLPAFSRTLASKRPTGRGRQTRRAFFLLSGSVLGIAGLGLGYAAFRAFASSATPTKHQSIAISAHKDIVAVAAPFVPKQASASLTFARHQKTIHALAWSPAGDLLASGASDKSVLIWNLAGQVQTQRDQDGTVHALAWSPNAHQLAVAATNQVSFLNAQTGATEARSMHTHHATVTTLAWSTQQPQLLVSGGMDKLAVVWNTQSFQPQTFFRLHSRGILSASWAASGQTIGTCSEGDVLRVWNGASGQQVHGFFSDGGVGMNVLAFEPEGTRLAVGGADGVLRLWQNGLVCQLPGNGQAQGQCLDQPLSLRAHTRPIRAVSWSPDGRLLASAGEDGLVFIWYPAQSQLPLLKIPQAASVLALSWSPNGRQLASASGKMVMLWTLS